MGDCSLLYGQCFRKGREAGGKEEEVNIREVLPSEGTPYALPRFILICTQNPSDRC